MLHFSSYSHHFNVLLTEAWLSPNLKQASKVLQMDRNSLEHLLHHFCGVTANKECVILFTSLILLVYRSMSWELWSVTKTYIFLQQVPGCRLEIETPSWWNDQVLCFYTHWAPLIIMFYFNIFLLFFDPSPEDSFHQVCLIVVAVCRYAREDTHYLLYIYDLMKLRLVKESSADSDMLLEVIYSLMHFPSSLCNVWFSLTALFSILLRWSSPLD
jgi:hypothetical protein